MTSAELRKLGGYVTIAEQALAKAKARGPEPGALICVTRGCG